jgi:hypothetical protein
LRTTKRESGERRTHTIWLHGFQRAPSHCEPRGSGRREPSGWRPQLQVRAHSMSGSSGSRQRSRPITLTACARSAGRR